MTTLVDCSRSDSAHWSFTLFGTRVRVEFWFWIALLILGARGGLIDALIWVGVCFVSILLHEMGHVFAFRACGRRAEVVLYGFGGLAIPNVDVVGTVPRVVVAVAGPVAGFCLAGITMALVVLTGGRIFPAWYMHLPHLTALLNTEFPLGLESVYLYSSATTIVNDLLFVNFWWGLVNLLPVWPLDGGHISCALLEQWDHYDGRRKSLIVSALAGAAVAMAAVVSRNTWVAILFGTYAFSSIQALGGERRQVIRAYKRYRE